MGRLFILPKFDEVSTICIEYFSRWKLLVFTSNASELYFLVVFFSFALLPIKPSYSQEEFALFYDYENYLSALIELELGNLNLFFFCQKLEQTVAAGKKLASLEEREHARMDAFRVAVWNQDSIVKFICLMICKYHTISLNSYTINLKKIIRNLHKKMTDCLFILQAHKEVETTRDLPFVSR